MTNDRELPIVKTQSLTYERLVELLSYDSSTGFFQWVKQRRGTSVGAKAGSEQSNGYISIRVDYVLHSAHRLAILFITGKMPDQNMEIDHINGIRTDNRYANLRVVSRTVNSQNLRKARENSLSGFLGVTKARNRWTAVIFVNSKRVRLGIFDSPEDAHAAYIKAKRALHEGCSI